MKSNNTEVFKTIMNPSTGKMVQSGGQLGKKIIKDYKAETIYNPLTGKQVKTGGSVGKKVLGMYKAKGGEGCKVDGNNIEVTLCQIANLPVVKEALKNEKKKKEELKKEELKEEKNTRNAIEHTTKVEVEFRKFSAFSEKNTTNNFKVTLEDYNIYTFLCSVLRKLKQNSTDITEEKIINFINENKTKGERLLIPRNYTIDMLKPYFKVILEVYKNEQGTDFIEKYCIHPDYVQNAAKKL